MDLIDRDKLCRAISNDHSHNNAHNTVEELTVVLREINNAPTVDAVPVVRCKDCKHYVLSKTILGDIIEECCVMQCNVNENDFCSYGETKTKEIL